LSSPVSIFGKLKNANNVAWNNTLERQKLLKSVSYSLVSAQFNRDLLNDNDRHSIGHTI